MHLGQRSVADVVSVSRTPFREALIYLAAIGIVSVRPHSTAVVPELEPGRLLEMFEVMAELEALSARHAARRMSDAERSTMMRAHQDSSPACEAGDVEACWSKVESFHKVLYRCSHSDFLAEQNLRLFRPLRLYRRLDLLSSGRMKCSFRERSAIVEALVAADGNTAAERVRRHVSIHGDRFSDLLDALGRMRQKKTWRPDIGPPRTLRVTHLAAAL